MMKVIHLKCQLPLSPISSPALPFSHFFLSLLSLLFLYTFLFSLFLTSCALCVLSFLYYSSHTHTISEELAEFCCALTPIEQTPHVRSCFWWWCLEEQMPFWKIPFKNKSSWSCYVLMPSLYAWTTRRYHQEYATGNPYSQPYIYFSSDLNPCSFFKDDI